MGVNWATGLYIVDCRMYIGCWKLGSFRVFGGAGHLVCGNWAKGLYIVDCRMYIGGWNWVRFAFLVRGRVDVGANWVRFVFFACWGGKLGFRLRSASTRQAFCILGCGGFEPPACAGG